MRRAVRCFIAALAMVAVLLADRVLPTGVAGAESTVADTLGVSSHLVWKSEAHAAAELAELRAGGLHWIREDFPWDQIEPTKGNFSWTRTDALMGAAAANGVEVLAILGYSAPWASSDTSGAGRRYHPPRDPAEFARYAAAVVARYGPSGAFWADRPDLVVRPLRAVEVWNEANANWFWKPDPDPARYAALVRATAEAVDAVGAGVEVLMVGDFRQARTDGSEPSWVGAVLDADRGLGQLIDGYTVHPYPWPRNRGPDAAGAGFDRVVSTREATVARGAALPVWITEIGWSTAAHPAGVTEAEQAAFVSAALGRVLNEWPLISRVFVYTWDRDRGDQGDLQAHYGLRRADGSPKPAWDALRAVASRAR